MFTVTISLAFLSDRNERGLPIGTLDNCPNHRKRIVTADAATMTDMVEDAAYQGWFTDADAGTIRAARTAFRDMVSAGIPYRAGVRMRNGLVEPRDA